MKKSWSEKSINNFVLRPSCRFIGNRSSYSIPLLTNNTKIYKNRFWFETHLMAHWHHSSGWRRLRSAKWRRRMWTTARVTMSRRTPPATGRESAPWSCGGRRWWSPRCRCCRPGSLLRQVQHPIQLPRYCWMRCWRWQRWCCWSWSAHRSCWWPGRGRCGAAIAARPAAAAHAGGAAAAGGGGDASEGGAGVALRPRPRRPCARDGRGRGRAGWQLWQRNGMAVPPLRLPQPLAGDAARGRGASGVRGQRDGRRACGHGRGRERGRRRLQRRRDGDGWAAWRFPVSPAAPRACGAPAARPGPGPASGPSAGPSPSGGPPWAGTSRRCSSGTCSSACGPSGWSSSRGCGSGRSWAASAGR